MTTTDARPDDTLAQYTAGLEDATRARSELRMLVRVDAAVVAVTGALLVGAAPWVTDIAGATPGAARAVGAGLVLLAVALAWLGGASDTSRLRWVPVSAVSDIVWAMASVGVAVLADLTGPGRALIATQGLLVLAIGEAKLVLHRRATPGHRPTQPVQDVSPV